MIAHGVCPTIQVSAPVAGNSTAVTTHTAKVVTQLSSLTKSYAGASGVQVSCWPGWWDADSAPADNSGGTGARIRSHEIGARVTWSVTGTTCIGVVFESSHWSALNALGQAWTPRNSYWRYRLTTNGTPGSWVYSIRPPHTDAGWLIVSGLTTSSTYIMEIESTHSIDPINASLNGDLGPIEYQREPSVAPTGEHSTMHQIRGFVADSGATYVTLSFAQTALNVLIIGDSNAAGVVNAGTTNVLIKNAGNNADYSNIDYQGHSGQVTRTLVDTYCTSANKRLVMHNISQGGLWIANMAPAIRFYYLGFNPGLASDVKDRFNKRTGYTDNIFPTYTPSGRPNPTWTPDLVVISMITNDQLIEAVIRIASPDPSIYGFGGATFRDDLVTNIGTIHSTWPSAKILVLNTHRADGPHPPPPTGTLDLLTTCKAKLAEACGASYLNLAASNWGRYFDLSSAFGSALYDPHMTAAQHETCRAAAQSTLTTLMGL